MDNKGIITVLLLVVGTGILVQAKSCRQCWSNTTSAATVAAATTLASHVNTTAGTGVAALQYDLNCTSAAATNCTNATDECLVAEYTFNAEPLVIKACVPKAQCSKAILPGVITAVKQGCCPAAGCSGYTPPPVPTIKKCYQCAGTTGNQTGPVSGQITGITDAKINTHSLSPNCVAEAKSPPPKSCYAFEQCVFAIYKKGTDKFYLRGCAPYDNCPSEIVSPLQAGVTKVTVKCCDDSDGCNVNTLTATENAAPNTLPFAWSLMVCIAGLMKFLSR
ncbi:uncharacterized protein LOC141907497 [Tubulanus polymorphus]|uniref:uncharacterized protein LOC141907497 n=1 Tax=Tubulanus polymorphus TaxID=672921 RepID=UPI003DA3D2E9